MLKRYYMLIVLFFITSPAYAHWHGAYSSSTNGFSVRSDWMNNISDSTKLSEMALPGTHDSATYDSNNNIERTQVLSFDQQLAYGVRVFDIRIRHTSDRFALHHGPSFLNKMFGDFLQSVNRFLESNPSETVLFRLKEDHRPNSNNTRSLEATLKFYLDQYPSKFLKTNNLGITLGEARGKFILLSNMVEFNAYGLRYGDDFNIQDDYYLATNWDLYSKWEKVRNQWDSTVYRGNSGRFYVNYLSGSGGSMPYFVASGHLNTGTSAPRLSTGRTTPGWKYSYPDFPRVNCFIGICTIAFEGINILFHDTLQRHNEALRDLPGRHGFSRSAGIVMSDFPGSALLGNIIYNNRPLEKPAYFNAAGPEELSGDYVGEYEDLDGVKALKANDPDYYENLQKKLVEEREEKSGVRENPQAYEAHLTEKM